MIDSQKIALSLNQVLVDTQMLALKTQSFHWNVTGPMFQSLHQLFGQQYEELQGAVDDIAERIRALKFSIPSSLSNITKNTRIKEEVPSLAKQMITTLLQGQETLEKTIQEAISISKSMNDEATTNLLIDRLGVHQKNAWMLRSLLVE